eukprot:1143853-Pelagomonas_calceolata.AAC.2
MSKFCGCKVIDTHVPWQGRVQPWGQPILQDTLRDLTGSESRTMSQQRLEEHLLPTGLSFFVPAPSWCTHGSEK